MDFRDFITLILFLVFIFAPFLKRKKNKNAQKPDKSKQSGFSVLGKIREALKEAALEMQAQAEQARKKEAAGQRRHPRELNENPFDQVGENAVNQTFWDEIDDREDVGFYPENADAQVIEPLEPVNEKPLCVSTKKEPHRKAAKIPEARGPTFFGHDAIQTSCLRAGPRRLPARTRGLRKAVIWSEILGKPVALRDSDSFCRY